MSSSSHFKVSSSSDGTQPTESTSLERSAPPSGSWLSGISSCLGSFRCWFSLGTRSTTHERSVSSEETHSLAPDANGTRTVKATWGSGFYSWYEKVFGNRSIEVTNVDTDQIESIPSKGSYNIDLSKKDSETLHFKTQLDASIRSTVQCNENAQSQESLLENEIERGTKCTIVSEKQDDTEKTRTLEESILLNFHQGMTKSIICLFMEEDVKKGLLPQKTCLITGRATLNAKYLMSEDQKSVIVSFTFNSYKESKAQIISTNSKKIKKLVRENNNDSYKEERSVLTCDKPGSSTTTMKIKAMLNADGSLNKDSLECLSVEGSWQIEALRKPIFNIWGKRKK